MNRQIWLWVNMFLVAISLNGFSQQLSPGDKIKLTAFNITDAISGEYFVQEDSTVYLPYLESVDTRDRSTDELRREILEKYRVIYADLELHIQLLYKVNVLGEINKPGLYYVSGTERVTDILAMAGGITNEANLKKILLIQDDNKTRINGKRILKDGLSAADIRLRSGDKIYVNRKLIGTRGVTVVISSLALMLAAYSTFK